MVQHVSQMKNVTKDIFLWYLMMNSGQVGESLFDIFMEVNLLTPWSLYFCFVEGLPEMLVNLARILMATLSFVSVPKFLQRAQFSTGMN